MQISGGRVRCHYDTDTTNRSKASLNVVNSKIDRNSHAVKQLVFVARCLPAERSFYILMETHLKLHLNIATVKSLC